jgi:hypothetical protein
MLPWVYRKLLSAAKLSLSSQCIVLSCLVQHGSRQLGAELRQSPHGPLICEL